MFVLLDATGQPGILIEIPLYPKADPSDPATYVSSGVAEHWIFDPERETVDIYRLAGARYQAAEVGDAITTPLLPGFSLAVRDLFVDL